MVPTPLHHLAYITEGKTVGFTHRWGALGVVLLATVVATAKDKNPQIVVMVINTAKVSAPVLYQAEVQAGGILRRAGIEVAWVNCGEPVEQDHCGRSPGWNEFVLQLAPSGMTSNDLVLGEAFLEEGGIGKYSDIFFDRVKELCKRSNTDISRLLGAIAVHEIGHLLLGSHSHSAFGIMQPVWTRENLRAIAMGTLFFLPQESKAMRRRMGEDRVTSRWASVRPSTAVGGNPRIHRGFLP